MRDSQSVNQLASVSIVHDIYNHIQFMDRTGSPVKASRVKQEMASLARYIFTKYHPLRRTQFEAEQKYFSRMLENYVSAKRTGLVHGGVGFRVRS